MQFNEYQSTLEDLQLSKQPKEIQEQFYEFLGGVPYIRRLVDSNRPRVADLPKDEEGKVIVDVTRPHILENMDYFRPAAIQFQKTGKYTNLRPNPNPNSEFYKWLNEEVRRCRDGYVRPDGEWITGDFYFFLNYCPIQLIKEDKKGKKIRTIDFPKVWEGHYYVTHYLQQARDKGLNAAELASRGKGKSYLGASLLARRYELGESDEVNKKVQCVVTASERKYLTGANQILDMFKYYIDFLANNTQFPSKKLTDTMQGLQWTSGYIDQVTNTRRGSENAVTGITSKDDESKLRGSRGVLYLIEEFGTFPRLLQLYNNMLPSVGDGDSVWGLIFAYGCVCAGTKVWTNDGRYINIENLRKEDGIVGYENNLPVKNTIGTLLEPRKKQCVRISWDNGKYLECSIDHPILKMIIHTPRVILGQSKRHRQAEYVWSRADQLRVGDRIIEGRYIGAFGNDTLEDPRLIGMLIGDGSYGFDNTPKFSNEDEELLDYIKNKYDYSISAQHITKSGKSYQELRVKNICKLLRRLGIYGQTKDKKRLPTRYQTLTEEDTKLLLAGLFDTDGCVCVRGANTSIQLTQANKTILEQVAILLRKFGITSQIVKNKPHIAAHRKDKNPWYILIISGRINIQLFYDNIPIIQKNKCSNLKLWKKWSEDNPIVKARCFDSDKIIVHKIVNIEYIGEQTIYNLSAQQSHTYLANNIITHNTAGDTESDFSAAQELMYNPVGYKMYALDNVYDLEGQGRNKFTYFFPGYINRDQCYDANGNSDVTKALLQILKDRYVLKYNSTDPNSLTKRIAEIPITPQEAILKAQGNIFPVSQLVQRLNELDNDPNVYSNVYVGELVFNSKGVLEYTPTADMPIREFPLKDNKSTGAIEFYQLPQEDSSGEIPYGRYIIGHDPVDQDTSGTLSLTSTFVLDLWTDKIVAEYTGRQQFADDNYEIVRKLCLFYNAKCLYERNKMGLFSYFSRMNSLYLLEDTPPYLKDKQIIKEVGYGNTAKGVNATQAVNNHANMLLANWLIKPVVIQTDDGQETTVPNLSFIKSRALLKELILYNPVINVDRVRAMGMVMMFREQMMVTYQGDFTSARRKKKKGAGYDDYFTRNYDAKLSKFSK